MNLTPRELERQAYMAGDTHGARAFALLDLLDTAPQDITGDVTAGFPDEDCLQEPIGDLRRLIVGMRRSNTRTELERIAGLLEEKQMELGRSAEYGREELQKAQRHWKRLTEGAS